MKRKKSPSVMYLDKYYDEIKMLREAGLSVAKLKDKYQVAYNTMHKYLKEKGI